jgi:hypothetical protein
MRAATINSIDAPLTPQGVSPPFICGQPDQSPGQSKGALTLSQDARTYVQLEIPMETLQRLIERKALVIEELRGLDRQTRGCIRQLLIDNLFSF